MSSNNNRLGSAYVLMSSVRGKLCLYHLNLEGATYTSDLKDGKGGHKALVRVSSGFAENTFVTGGEDGNLCLWRARDATGTAGATPDARRQRSS